MGKKHIWVILLVAGVALGFFAASAYWGKWMPWNEKAAIAQRHQGPTLRSVKGRGVLKVGIRSSDMKGMMEHISKAEKEGMEADLAKAIAAAIGVDIKWVPVGGTTRFSYLNNGKVDVTIRTVTANSMRDIQEINTNKGYKLGPVYYYDGTNVVLNPDNLPDPDEDINIIVANGSSNHTDLKNLKDGKNPYYSWPDDWEIIPALESSPNADDASAVAKNAFKAGIYGTTPIHGYCSDGVAVIGVIIEMDKEGEWTPKFSPPITKSPLAFCIKEGDTNWSEVISWVFYVLLEADELENKYDVLEPTVPGLSAGWSQNVINAVGDYSDIWDDNLGKYSGAFDDARKLNKSWKYGGLLYSPPIVP